MKKKIVALVLVLCVTASLFSAEKRPVAKKSSWAIDGGYSLFDPIFIRSLFDTGLSGIMSGAQMQVRKTDQWGHFRMGYPFSIGYYPVDLTAPRKGFLMFFSLAAVPAAVFDLPHSTLDIGLGLKGSGGFTMDDKGAFGPAFSASTILEAGWRYRLPNQSALGVRLEAEWSFLLLSFLASASVEYEF